MLNWLWKVIAGLSGIVALWFGLDAARTKQRMKREQAERDQAMDRMAEKAYQDLMEARKRKDAKAPIDAKKRTEFEQ